MFSEHSVTLRFADIFEIFTDKFRPLKLTFDIYINICVEFIINCNNFAFKIIEHDKMDIFSSYFTLFYGENVPSQANGRSE